MRVGQRLQFRNLRCVTRYVREERLRDGTEITRWYYSFAGVDGRTYNYRGKYLFKMDPGCYYDCEATVSYIRGREITIQRPKRLEPEPTLRLI